METTPGALPASGMKAKIPNLLTAGRVVLAIAFFAILAPWDVRKSPAFIDSVPDWTLFAATVMFIVAAITDALDGHLARKWNVVSAFGRIMDPFADKILVLGAFVLLAGPGFAIEMLMKPQGVAASLGTGSGTVEMWLVSGVQPWMVVVILARELLVTSIRGAVESAGGSFGASWSGKAKMILQCICIPLVLVLINLQATDAGGLARLYEGSIHVVVWLTVLVTAWSGVPYLTRGIAALRAAKPVSTTGGA
jgi:CDP-diacylglycerol---glycerol-3-phosphate 3-phosphatidyltransferase